MDEFDFNQFFMQEKTALNPEAAASDQISDYNPLFVTWFLHKCDLLGIWSSIEAIEDVPCMLSGGVCLNGAAQDPKTLHEI